MSREDWHVSGSLLKNQIAIGIPMALQYSITAIGTMMVQSSLNILGSTLVAAYTAAGKIEQIVTQAYVAMGTTMATYGAQNMGAGDVPRIRQGFKACTVIGIPSKVADSRQPQFLALPWVLQNPEHLWAVLSCLKTDVI